MFFFFSGIEIFVTSNELNPKTSILNFHPTDSLNYNNYGLQVDSVSAADTTFMSECQNFAETFGFVEITTCPCGRYWVHKPPMCEVNFKVDAYVGDTAISNTVTLFADDSKMHFPYRYRGEIPDSGSGISLLYICGDTRPCAILIPAWGSIWGVFGFFPQ